MGKSSPSQFFNWNVGNLEGKLQWFDLLGNAPSRDKSRFIPGQIQVYPEFLGSFQSDFAQESLLWEEGIWEFTASPFPEFPVGIGDFRALFLWIVGSSPSLYSQISRNHFQAFSAFLGFFPLEQQIQDPSVSLFLWMFGDFQDPRDPGIPGSQLGGNRGNLGKSRKIQENLGGSQSFPVRRELGLGAGKIRENN